MLIGCVKSIHGGLSSGYLSRRIGIQAALTETDKALASQPRFRSLFSHSDARGWAYPPVIGPDRKTAAHRRRRREQRRSPTQGERLQRRLDGARAGHALSPRQEIQNGPLPVQREPTILDPVNDFPVGQPLSRDAINADLAAGPREMDRHFLNPRIGRTRIHDEHRDALAVRRGDGRVGRAARRNFFFRHVRHYITAWAIARPPPGARRRRP